LFPPDGGVRLGEIGFRVDTERNHMMPDRFDFAPHRPWYARGARCRSAVLATATAVVLFGFVGATPAYAEEVVPTDPAVTSEPVAPTPTEEPVPTAEPTPTEEPIPTVEPTPTTEPTPTPTPTPEPTPTPTPTPEPTPTPTPEPTPTPTPDPTPTPTPTPDPTSTPTPDPTATPTPEPGTQAPGTQAPAIYTGTGSVVRFTTTSTSTSTTGATAQASALLAARAKIDLAVANLRDAEAALADARSMREAARATAERLQEAADEAQLDADAAGRVYLAAVRGDGTTVSSMDAVFGAGKDLLAGLGGVARVTQIAGDAEKFLEIAAEKTEEATAAQERADAAFAAVDAVPVEALEAEVASAEQAVTAARQALTDLQAQQASAQSRLASSSVSLLSNLPSDAGQLSDQGWALPVSGRITSGFGPRPVKPLPGVNDFHRGTDLAAACNTAVFAATSGVVVSAGPNGGLGNWVLIDHGSGVATGYGHLTTGGIFVSPGETVTAGQLIGAVGSTGASTGCHLHFEVHLGGVAIDAVPFMAARGIVLG
jgi:murein DD-endopeptidase MepM/ murein hydrolase activator NlpD